MFNSLADVRGLVLNFFVKVKICIESMSNLSIIL
jgi:hypothetical protein